MPALNEGARSRLILASLFCASALFLLSIPSFPLNDDWAYAWAVKNWGETGSLRLSNWGSPTLLFQLAWGRLFCLPFGFSFDALRWSTLVLAFAGILAFHETLLRLGASPKASLAGALTLLFNPLFFVWSHSFMSDVPGLALMLISGWALVEGLERREDGWLAFGAVSSALAYLVRQTGPGPAVAAAFWRPKRAWLLIGIPLAAVVGHAFWLRQAGPTFAFKGYLVSATLKHLSRPGLLARDTLGRLAGASLYLGLFLFPCALAPLKRRGSPAAVAALAGIWLAVLGLRIPLATGNSVGRFGLGTCTPADCAAKASGIFAWPPFWTIATFAAPLVLCALLWRIDFGRRLWRSSLGAYVSGFLLAFALSLAGRDYYDRYYLVLFPPLIALAVLEMRIGWRYVAPALACLAAWSFLGTWDYLAWNAARWKAGERLHAKGIPYERIDGGLDWNAYYGYEKGIERLLKEKPLDAIRWDEWLDGAKFDGFVAFSSAHIDPTESQPYWSPLSFRQESIYLWNNSTPLNFLNASLEKFDSKDGAQVLWDLCRTIDRPCGLEDAFPDLESSSRMTMARITPVNILDELVRRHPKYQWVVQDGVINVRPRSPEFGDVLSKKIDVSIHGASSFKAALDVLQQLDIPIGYQIMGRPGRYAVIDLKLKDVSAREALNAIARIDRQLLWAVALKSAVPGLPHAMLTMPSWRKTGLPFSIKEREEVGQNWARQKKRRKA